MKQKYIISSNSSRWEMSFDKDEEAFEFAKKEEVLSHCIIQKEIDGEPHSWHQETKSWVSPINMYLYYHLILLLRIHDQKEKQKTWYSRIALGHYLKAAQEARAAVQRGMTWNDALKEGFTFSERKNAVTFDLAPVRRFVRFLSTSPQVEYKLLK